MLGEYDAGYENYIDSLIREIEKLQDENDKLHEQVSSLVGRSFRTADKMSCIQAENAKLRELVRDLWEACPADGYYCIYHCKHYDKESKSHCKLEDRMRELGVEVEE